MGPKDPARSRAAIKLVRGSLLETLGRLIAFYQDFLVYEYFLAANSQNIFRNKIHYYYFYMTEI